MFGAVAYTQLGFNLSNRGSPRETGPKGSSNRTQIFTDSADQHGFFRVCLKRRPHRGRIDSGVHRVDAQESKQ
ncbi:MAG: hypothetical protein DWQ34_06315 [Planctomycetota bacterium]|nr:MAG: hypothetical protein DWQ34_06315 [Planctomycetota bacterium]